MCVCVRVYVCANAHNCSEHSLSIIDDILFTLPPTERFLEEKPSEKNLLFNFLFNDDVGG